MQESLKRQQRKKGEPIDLSSNDLKSLWRKKNNDIGFYDEGFVTDEIRDKLKPIYEMPFWIDDPVKHGFAFNNFGRKCCFNHYIGEPIKHGRPHPIYDYEMNIFNLLFQENKRRIWIKKSTGLGVTEFMIRLMSWLALYSNALRGLQQAIVTGPRQKTAEDLVTRMKDLFKSRLGIDYTDKFNKTTLVLNGCRIQAYPSRNIAGLRAQQNLAFILVDEADFFPYNDQEKVRDAVERYIGKNDAIILMVSTPGEPNGLFEKIENEPTQEEIDRKNLKTQPCIYERVYYDYTVGEGKIYNDYDISEAKKSPSWLREYCLQYGYGTGTVFSTDTMDDIKRLGEQYRADYNKINPFTMKAMGIDPAFGGSSGTAITVTELHDAGCIRVIYSKRRMGLDYGEITDWVMDLRQFFDPNKIYVDGWHVGFIRTLKKKIGERWKDEDIDLLKQRARKYKQPLEKYMYVLPVQFAGKTREILGNSKDLIETQRALAIDEQEFHDLYMDTLSAKQDDGKLVKSDDDPKDLFESLEMCLLYYTASTNTAPNVSY